MTCPDIDTVIILVAVIGVFFGVLVGYAVWGVRK